HITDLHLDPFYLPSPNPQLNCHRGGLLPSSGSTGEASTTTPNNHYYGFNGCDSPPALITQTFAALQRKHAAKTDFVLWTGDSSRHDRDKDLPRDASEIYSQNAQIVAHFQHTFNVSQTVILPAIGNWDVWPPGRLGSGPNVELDKLYQVYSPLFASLQNNGNVSNTIEEAFKYGGYYSWEVQPNTLAVISLNTLYFFEENDAVADCSPFVPGVPPGGSSIPGDEQLKWFHDLLHSFRMRGMKALVIGHVPPINVENKVLYYDNCFKMFVHLSGHYSDVILGQYYGHTNRDVTSFITTDRHLLHQEEDLSKRHHISIADSKITYDIVSLSSDTLEEFDLSAKTLVGFVRTSPSIIPVTNPGFKIGMVHINVTAEEGTVVYLAEDTQYYVDLDAANAIHESSQGNRTNSMIPTDPIEIEFTKDGCASRHDFGLRNMTMPEFERLLLRMQRQEAGGKAHKSDSGSSNNNTTTAKVSLMRRYLRCMDVRPSAPGSPSDGDEDDSLYLSRGTVWAILVGATVVFGFTMGGFGWYMRKLNEEGSVLERQWLLSRSVPNGVGNGNGNGYGRGGQSPQQQQRYDSRYYTS
ncbi:Endopolyphosphatase, partial [Quaeritorhiza haematococci]